MSDVPNTKPFLEHGGAWVLMQFALMTAVIVLGVMYRADTSHVALTATGAILLLVGSLFGIAGMWVLGRNHTPFPKPREHSQLVQSGIYARVRHPLYSSVMLVSLGWALFWQSAASFIAALVLIPFFHAKAWREERWLREKFPEYAAYEQRVPRFIPRFFRIRILD